MKNKNRLLTSIGSLLASCSVVAAAQECSHAEGHPWTQSQRQAGLSVNSERPVAYAIRSLITQYPLPITYEDPRYQYTGDIKDITQVARSDANIGKPGTVLVPRGGALAVNYDVALDSGEPIDTRDILLRIVEAERLRENGGRFRIEQSGSVFHVLPKEVRNSNGVWVHQPSILDTRISFPSQELTGDEMLRAVTNAVSLKTGVYVGIGRMSMNLFGRYRGHLEADNEPARDVLLRVLHSVNDRLTWRLLYGPDVKWYALNIVTIAEKSADQSMPPRESLGPSPVTRRLPQNQEE